VNVVAQRARHISAEWEAEGEPQDDKPVSIAIDEVYAGKLTVNSAEKSDAACAAESAAEEAAD
jgi:DNA-directed RNA polymerase subunit K/omega